MNKTSGKKLNTSRYGRVSTKRKFDEEFDTVLRESSEQINEALGLSPKGHNFSLETDNLTMRNGKNHGYCIGDMVWAKTGKYPVWPGIIISDPESNKFFKKENNGSNMLHIYYCNDAYRRNWIKLSQVFDFSSKNQILAEFPRTTTQISRSKLKIKWHRAVDEAECLAGMNRDNRISEFFTNNFLPNVNVPLLDNSEVNTLLNKSTKDQTLNSDTIQEARSTPNVNTCIKSTKSKKQNVNQKKSTLIVQQDEMSSKEHPRKLIPELCKLFYTNGWVTGTGGGISIKLNDKIFIAPSGVQKERIESEDIFVQDIDGQDIEVPPIEKHLSKSQCTPIFMCSFSERNAGAVIHVHSQEIVKLCLLNPENEIRIRDLEIIKGVFNEEKSKFYDNDEEVIIPIIENSKYEKDLVHTFMIALKKYPQTSAVLVRNHGMYVWGKDWKLAKTQCECYIYAFNIMIFKKLNNL